MLCRLILSPGLAGPTRARCTTPRVPLMRVISRVAAVAGASPAPPTMTRILLCRAVLGRAPLATTGTRSTLITPLNLQNQTPLLLQSPLPIPLLVLRWVAAYRLRLRLLMMWVWTESSFMSMMS
ncbi:MAG: hypothetical protein ACFFDI_00610 [Promethearchaeota archaeon]